MFVPKLEKIAKDRDAWDFGEVLDLRNICTVEVAYDEEEDGDYCYASALVAHVGGLAGSGMVRINGD